MIKYISVFILIGGVSSSSFFSEFIKSNNNFLNNNFQCINFDYELKNSIEVFPDSGEGIIGITQDKYVVYLHEHIFLFQNSFVKQYNKQTNQIFINYSNLLIDSIITQFFTSKNLEKYNTETSDYIIIPIDFIDSPVSLKISVDEAKKNISLIQMAMNDLDISLFNIELLKECSDTTELFQLNYLDAFILDLRD